jgi:hypothetical protein
MKLSDIVGSVVFGALALGLIALIAYPLVKCISADGRVEYCYVLTERHTVPNQADVVVYQLWGFRPWRSDRNISPALKSMEEVKAAAEAYGCNLR